jgi:hypothetical protein
MAGSGNGGSGGSAGACTFAQQYDFMLPNGTRGLFYRMQSTVGLNRTLAGSDVAVSCSVPLPACNSPTAVDASDIIADIADPDVQRALTTAPRPVYGDRSVSASTFSFDDTTGAATGGFSVIVGHECTTATATCEPTPVGVARLVTDVNSVVSTALADPSCASLR